jgi:hypothetical protein
LSTPLPSSRTGDAVLHHRDQVVGDGAVEKRVRRCAGQRVVEEDHPEVARHRLHLVAERRCTPTHSEELTTSAVPVAGGCTENVATVPSVTLTRLSVAVVGAEAQIRP